MAYKGKKRQRTHYKRKEADKQAKAVICRTPGVCPDVMCVQLSYNTRQNALGGGAVPIVDFVYRGNSCFDPEFAIGGAQPMGFDQWAAFYRRYRVKGIKVILQGAADAAINAGMGIAIMNTSSNLTDRDNAIEQRYGVNKLLGSDSSHGVDTLEYYIPTHVIRGGPRDLVQYEQDLTALVNTNPAQQFFVHTYAYGVGASGNSFEVNLDTKLIYYVEFYDRESLPQS